MVLFSSPKGKAGVRFFYPLKLLQCGIIIIVKNSKKYVNCIDAEIQSCKCKIEEISLEVVIDISSKSSTGFSACYKCTNCNATGKKCEFPKRNSGKYKKII